jgi:type IV pilus assembly protein PilN
VIRVNLLGDVPAAAVRPWLPADQKSAAAGLVLLLATALGVGGWWWQIASARADVDARIQAAESELARLKQVSLLVDKAVAAKLELTERLGLIDRLHRTQRAPVELLQTISRSVPEGLWLIELKQTGPAIQLEGRATSLTSLTDFVDHLQTSGRFERPVDIVTTSMELVEESPVVRFAVKAMVR